MSEEQFNFENLEMRVEKIENKIEKLPTKEEMELSNEKLVNRVLNKADERYAAKLTEKIVFAGTGAALLWGLNQILGLL